MIKIIVLSSHPAISVQIAALRALTNISAGDDTRTQVFIMLSVGRLLSLVTCTFQGIFFSIISPPAFSFLRYKNLSTFTSQFSRKKNKKKRPSLFGLVSLYLFCAF